MESSRQLNKKKSAFSIERVRSNSRSDANNRGGQKSIDLGDIRSQIVSEISKKLPVPAEPVL